MYRPIRLNSPCSVLQTKLLKNIYFDTAGIMFEGIGIACAGIWGSTIGLTSYSQNIAAIGITKVCIIYRLKELRMRNICMIE